MDCSTCDLNLFDVSFGFFFVTLKCLGLNGFKIV